MLMIQKPKCETDKTTTIRTSSQSHLHWKDHFHENPLYFRINADFEAGNGFDNSNIDNKTTNIYKQNPVCIGYFIKFELNAVLQSGCYESPLDYDIVDWFINEIIKIQIKMAFYFDNTKKDFIMTEKDEEFKIENICRFFEKNIESDKLGDHCHLTCKYRGPAHNKCNINVTQKQSNLTNCILQFQ